MEIIYSSLHNIYTEKKAYKYIDIKRNMEAKDYIDNLIVDVFDNKNKRKYEIGESLSLVTEFVIELFELKLNDKIIDGRIEDETFSNYNNRIAEKLLHEEYDAQDKLNKTLGKKIREGSLIQVFFENNGNLFYLVSKVENDTFFDEESVKYSRGLIKDRKPFRSCLYKYSQEGRIDEILLSDQNTKPTKYWQEKFLEIVEKTTDITNTQKSFNLLKSQIGRKLKDFPADALYIRNRMYGYFDSNEEFELSKFLEDVCSKYEIIEKELKNKKTHTPKDIKNKAKVDAVKEFKNNINGVFNEKEIDTKFNINTIGITKSVYKDKIEISKNIVLMLEGATEELEETIKVESDDDGERYLRINADESILKRFDW